MKKWNKEDAIKAIQDLIDQVAIVQTHGRKSDNHMRWLANTLRIIEEIFGANSRYYLSLANFSWHETGQMIFQSYDIEGAIEHRHNRAFVAQLNQARGLLLAARDHLEQSKIEDVYDGKNTPDETNEIMKIINLVSNKLRKIIRSVPDKEKDIQDKFEDLLLANDIEFSREFPHIEYSSKKYIPDFSFKKIDLAVEVKLCKRDEKVLISELNDDILAYKTLFRNILFIIYDLGQIRDQEFFKASFETNPDVIIQIIKH